MANLTEKPERLTVDIAWSALLKILSLLLALFIVVNLGRFIGLILVAILLAVTLDIVVKKLGVKRNIAIFLLLLATLGFVLAFSVLMVPNLIDQLQSTIEKLPQIRQELLEKLPKGRATTEAEHLWAHPEVLIGSWQEKLLTFGTFVTLAFYSVGVIITFSFYFLLAGGKIITSLMVCVYIFALMSFLGVPAPLMLAALAAILDIVLVVGVLILASAAGFLALAVSSQTALYAIAGILVYQAFENYVIVPKVYGNRMRLSNLVVLISLAIGGFLAGPIGVLLALPIAAAYPPIERIWLKKYLTDEVIEKHQKLER